MVVQYHSQGSGTIGINALHEDDQYSFINGMKTQENVNIGYWYL